LRNSPNFVPIGASIFYIPTVAALGQAYNSLSGEGTSGSQQTAFEAGYMFTNTMMGQVAGWLSDDSAVGGIESAPLALNFASARGDVSREQAAFTDALATAPRTWRAWGISFGASQMVAGDLTAGSAGMRSTTWGGALGFDYQPSRNFMFGFAAGSAESAFAVNDRYTTGDVNGGHFGIYGVARSEQLYAAIAVSYARLTNSTKRLIPGVGTLPSETATGGFSSNELYGRFELGWKVPVGSVKLTPFVAVEYAQLWQNGYTESSLTAGGAPGMLGLTYQPQVTDSLPTFVGAQVETTWADAFGVSYTPFLRASWVHEFEPDRTVVPSFIAAPGFNFTIEGARAASDGARVDAGFKVNLSRNFGLYANFNGEFSPRSEVYSGTGGFKYAW
jgi:outer membrane autotransporter protein